MRSTATGSNTGEATDEKASSGVVGYSACI